MITLHQVECPKCHGQLNSTNPLSGQYACPFCCTVFHITANMTIQAEMPEQIIPFTISEKDFEKVAWQKLIEEKYAPENISGLIEFENIRGFYLPVFLYDGQYECSWSCKVKQIPENTDTTNTQKSIYSLQNGVSKSGYTFVCPAYNGVESSNELAEYICSLKCKSSDLKSFHSDDLSGYFFLPGNRNSSEVWNQWGEKTLDSIARTNTLTQLQSSDIKEFNCTVSSGSSHEGKYVFFPVWMIRYQYNNKLHHIYMDGTGINDIKGTELVDDTLKARVEKPFMILKFISVIAIVIPLLMMLASWYIPAIIALVALWLVFFGYRFYARWHKDRVISNARKKREKALIS